MNFIYLYGGFLVLPIMHMVTFHGFCFGGLVIHYFGLVPVDLELMPIRNLEGGLRSGEGFSEQSLRCPSQYPKNKYLER